MRHLPPEAAINGHGWTVEALLLGDIIHVLTDQWHPSDPRAHKKLPGGADAAAFTAARKRAAQRRQRLGITGSVLRQRPEGG